MKTILVVDDSRFYRNIIKDKLTKAGYRIVAEAGDGIEALDLYMKHHPDLITMDIIMPKQSGIDTIKEIFAFDPAAKIIVMTALGHAPIVRRALNLGVAEVLVKPVNFPELIEAVEFVFKNHPPSY